MRNAGVFLILSIFIFSCIKDKEKINIAHFRRYSHYLTYDTAHYRNEFVIRYSYDYLNDSVILMKIYSFGDLVYKSIVYQNDKLEKDKIDTIDYQQYYLFLKGASIPQKTYYFSDIDVVNDEYYNFESERVINIGLDSFKIMSFFRDFDGDDGELRIFFNQKFGILALYSNSDFDASICRNTADKKNEKDRIQLINKLIADTTFFPFPRERYPMPPQ